MRGLETALPVRSAWSSRLMPSRQGPEYTNAILHVLVVWTCIAARVDSSLHESSCKRTSVVQDLVVVPARLKVMCIVEWCIAPQDREEPEGLWRLRDLDNGQWRRNIVERYFGRGNMDTVNEIVHSAAVRADVPL